MTATMTCLAAAGPNQALTLTTAEVPEPGAGEARVKVGYCGVKPLDVMALRGTAPWLEVSWPFVPGFEYAGVVDGIGEGVDEALLGQRVYAEVGKGGCAEYAVCSAQALRQLHSGIDLKTGSVYATCAHAAYYLVHYMLGDLEGKAVAVHSAAGAVGSMILQMGKERGARLIGLVGGAEKFDHARKHGAHEVVDYLDDGWPQRVKALTDDVGADIILDTNGGKRGTLNFDAVAIGGEILYIGNTAGEFPPPVEISTLIFATCRVGGYNVAKLRERYGTEAQSTVAEGVAAGRWTAPVSRVVPLSEAAALIADLEARRLVGRGVVAIGGDIA